MTTTTDRRVEDFTIVRLLSKALDVENKINATLRANKLPVATAAQTRTLLLLEGGKISSPKQIAARLHTRNHTLSGILRKLEARRLITRKVDIFDRRRTIVSLTVDGTAQLEMLHAIMEAVEQEMTR